MKIACVFGTRPEIIKLAPVIKEIQKSDEELLLIHTGQHYDYSLSDVFMEELNLPSPDYNLDVGSGTVVEQISESMRKLEGPFEEEEPDIVLVQGDTNIVPAALLTARQMMIPSGHVEAGLRSFNETSHEEVNKRVAAPLALLHFAPTELNKKILLESGADEDNVFVTGNTIIDVIRMVEGRIDEGKVLDRLGVDRSKPILTVTAHRPTNVDRENRLKEIFETLVELEDFDVVFPIHPRTRKNAVRFGIMKMLEDAPHVTLTDPLGYVDFLSLMSASEVLLTDSGGLQEEACELKKPVVVMRNTTPRWEAVEQGFAFLTEVDRKRIVRKVKNFYESKELRNRIKRLSNPYGEGKAGKKIFDFIRKYYLEGRLKYEEPSSDTLKCVADTLLMNPLNFEDV